MDDHNSFTNLPPQIESENIIIKIKFDQQNQNRFYSLDTGGIFKIYSLSEQKSLIYFQHDFTENAMKGKSLRDMEIDPYNRNKIQITHSNGFVQKLDIESDRIENRLTQSNQSSTNVVQLIKDNILLVGDDSGCVRLQDVRTSELILKNESDFEDQISGVAIYNGNQYISSLDGSIGQFDDRIFTNDAYLKQEDWKPRSKSNYNESSFNDLIINNKVIQLPADDQSLYLYNPANIKDFADVRAIGKDISCLVQLQDDKLLIGDEEKGNLNIVDIKEVTRENNIDGGAMRISKLLGDNINDGSETRFDPIVSLDVSESQNLVAASYGKSNIVDFYLVSDLLAELDQDKDDCWLKRKEIKKNKFDNVMNENDDDFFEDM